jgi:hypothetical protein
MEIDSIPIDFAHYIAHSGSTLHHQNDMNSHHHLHGKIMTPTSRNELLEDWPSRITGDCWSIDANDQSNHWVRARPQVTFSKLSSVQIYPHDPAVMRDMSYTKDERKSFCNEAVAECLRIRQLLHSTPGGFNKDSFKCLIKNNVVSMEEIVGIDHMVLGKSASLIKERQEHIRSVVSAQYDIFMTGGDSVEKLAAFCASRSSRAVKRARVRAALSCPRKENLPISSASQEREENEDASYLTTTHNDISLKSLPQDRTHINIDKRLIVTSSTLIASPSRSKKSSSTSSNRARMNTALAA